MFGMIPLLWSKQTCFFKHFLLREVGWLWHSDLKKYYKSWHRWNCMFWDAWAWQGWCQKCFFALPFALCYKRREVWKYKRCSTKSCYFGNVKGECERSQYHPSSLKALGIFLKYHGVKRPSFWIKDLQKVKESSLFAGTGEPFDHHS